jgi:hypothetical protein
MHKAPATGQFWPEIPCYMKISSPSVATRRTPPRPVMRPYGKGHTRAGSIQQAERHQGQELLGVGDDVAALKHLVDFLLAEHVCG